jgi:hypothetical protein
MQCMVAVGLGTWGVLGVQGSFLPIRTTEVMGKQTIDTLEPGQQAAADEFAVALPLIATRSLSRIVCRPRFHALQHSAAAMSTPGSSLSGLASLRAVRAVVCTAWE